MTKKFDLSTKAKRDVARRSATHLSGAATLVELYDPANGPLSKQTIQHLKELADALVKAAQAEENKTREA